MAVEVESEGCLGHGFALDENVDELVCSCAGLRGWRPLGTNETESKEK